MGIFRYDGVFVIQFQGADKAAFKFGKEVKRTTEKGNVTADRLTAGKTADGLVYHCLENRSRQIFSGSTFIDQRLDIGLGKYTATRSDRVDGLVIFGIFIQTCCICLDAGMPSGR